MHTFGRELNQYCSPDCIQVDTNVLNTINKMISLLNESVNIERLLKDFILINLHFKTVKNEME